MVALCVVVVLLLVVVLVLVDAVACEFGMKGPKGNDDCLNLLLLLVLLCCSFNFSNVTSTLSLLLFRSIFRIDLSFVSWFIGVDVIGVTEPENQTLGTSYG